MCNVYQGSCFHGSKAMIRPVVNVTCLEAYVTPNYYIDIINNIVITDAYEEE